MEPLLLGWREWVALPELGVPAIKVKVDTGARTSALHAFHIDAFERDGASWVSFHLHPLQKNTEQVVICEAPLLESRVVSDSGGHRANRPVIRTPVVFGGGPSLIDLTFHNRHSLPFRNLLG